MTTDVLASFTARDGSGKWEVTRDGIRVDGELWHFTNCSSVICAITPGHSEAHTEFVEDNDGIGFWAGLAAYQETGSLATAGLAAWAFSDSRTMTKGQVPCHLWGRSWIKKLYVSS